MPNRIVFPGGINPILLISRKASRIGQAQSSHLGLSQAGIVEVAWPPFPGGYQAHLALAHRALTSLSLMSSQRRSCSICRSRSLISAMAQPPARVRVGATAPSAPHRGILRKAKTRPQVSVRAGRRGETGRWGWPVPLPRLPSHWPPDPQRPTALVALIANSRRPSPPRAKDGSLEGSQAITAAATPARALGLPASLLPSAWAAATATSTSGPTAEAEAAQCRRAPDMASYTLGPLPRRALNSASRGCE